MYANMFQILFMIHRENRKTLEYCYVRHIKSSNAEMSRHDGKNSIEILLALKFWFKRAFGSIGTICYQLTAEVVAPRSEVARPDGSSCYRRAFSSEITSFSRCYGHSVTLSVLAFNNTGYTKRNATPRSSVRSRRLRQICGVSVVAARELDWFLGKFVLSRKLLGAASYPSVFCPSFHRYQRGSHWM
jgi:hypothetical protein